MSLTCRHTWEKATAFEFEQMMQTLNSTWEVLHVQGVVIECNNFAM
jgi:hypothetical protein